jgi:membrane protein
MIYIVMPNTKVNIKSGIIAGILAGTAFSFLQWFYIDLQVGVSRYNAIYGSFAALPLFLAWLQFSWLIVLFGAEISFAHQNQDQYEFELETENISHHSIRILSLLILNRIVKHFANGKPAQTAQEISKELKLPIRLVRSILQILVDCNIVAPMHTKEPKTPAYQPAQYIDRFTISFIINAIDNQGTRLEPDLPQLKKIIEYHKAFAKKSEKLDENILVKDL